MNAKLLRLGTRGSHLARWQAGWVADQLRRAAGVRVELVPISTSGDQNRQASIGSLGTTGAFTKELQRALLAGDIDLAVHSLKDLPTEPVEGLALAAVPPRAEVADAWLSGSGTLWTDLPQGARVGTGSLRRRAQLWHLRPDLEMVDARGNIDTRLRKLEEGQFDAMVLAVAGLTRLGLERHIAAVIPSEVMMPAVGQGALGIETRADDARTQAAVAGLDHPESHQAVLAERQLLASLAGGCLAPIGAWARSTGEGQLTLGSVVLDARGQRRLSGEAVGPWAQALELGQRVAEQLLAQGAAELIAGSRGGG